MPRHRPEEPRLPKAKLKWGVAFRAVRKLLANTEDTEQVFVVMNALNADESKGYHRLLETAKGGRIAYRRPELAEWFADPAFRAAFAPGTVGAAYRDFLARTGYSADGLAAVSEVAGNDRPVEHPYEWFGRRVRDVHDVWHILTGYDVDETMGEAALVAFSYAQTRGLGWLVISVGIAAQSIVEGRTLLFARAVREGYRRGRDAAWLLGEDYETLMHEQLNAVRHRLGLEEPIAYLRAQRALPLSVTAFGTTRAMAVELG